MDCYQSLTQHAKSNFVQNPSFERGLSNWTSNNVTIANNNAFEGTASARLGPGIASLHQDIPINMNSREKSYFLFGFAVQAPVNVNPGNLIVEIEWLNSTGASIGIGLKLFIANNTTGTQISWLTYSDVTEIIPNNAKKARIIFSKSVGEDNPNDVLDIDKIFMAKVRV
ncbi:hypothetical protein [Clostridium ganghwense]|uniref:Uncharacterized protein n=1 Tax=Clostridium ganghwense TaxID=312089 RepID=A0ABT4CQ06_9CLOT|nr:hypothetical protein [Clostridium ganghwense]MCY6370171.1 hypothetical protein [Clostridium ganghwense]